MIKNNHKFNRYKKYKAYLNTDAWKEKRKCVLERDNNKCVMCGSRNKLSAHHLTYKNLFKEPLDDLITLCTSCHKEEHDNQNKYK